MIESFPPGGPVPGQMLLAGYFVAVLELPTASDCLIDWLPEDGCWFAGVSEALEACLPIQVPPAARLYALMVPADHVGGFVADILAAGTDEPVLLDHLDRRGGEPAREVASGGRGIGWDVLGYDIGLLHSWHCNGLYEDGVRELGVETDDDRGLLPDREAAVRVAAWANARTDTKPVTWFPAALVEWDTPIQGRTGPAATEAPAPWWRRIF